MTRLFVDKREVAPLPPHLNSLEQVVRLVEEKHVPPNSVIRQVHLDGLPLNGDERITNLSGRIDNHEKIEVFTGTMQEVAFESIREAMAFMERMGAATQCLASSFRASASAKEFSDLKQLYEGFYWTNVLLDRLMQSFHMSLDSICVDGDSAKHHQEKLGTALKGLIEAHQQSDFGLLADLLEYELAPLIRASATIFAIARERVLASA